MVLEGRPNGSDTIRKYETKDERTMFLAGLETEVLKLLNREKSSRKNTPVVHKLS